MIVTTGIGKWRRSFDQWRGDIDEIRGRGLAGEILLPSAEAAGRDVILLAEVSLSESTGGVFLQ